MKEMIVRLPEESVDSFMLLVKNNGWEAFENSDEYFEGLKVAQRRLTNRDRSKNKTWEEVREGVREKYGI
jgi:hypothetical protein